MPARFINPIRDWITAHALMIALGFVALFLALTAVQTVRIDGLQLRLPVIGTIGPQGWRPRALEAEAKFRFEIEAHRQTKDNYREAQAAAARQQIIRIAMHQREVEQINEKHRVTLNRSLADLRARYQRLLARGQTGAGAASATGTVRVPIYPDAAGRADAAARGAGLPAARDPLDQLERDWIATRQAHQLDALIAWVEDQVAAGRAWQQEAGE